MPEIRHLNPDILSVTLIDLNMYIACIGSVSKPMEILLLLVAMTLNHADILIFIHRSQNALQRKASVIIHYACVYTGTCVYIFT